jgi:imidazolonepropionase
VDANSERIPADFALFNVGSVVTMAPGSHPDARGPLGSIQRGALAAREGKIVWVGHMDRFHDDVRLSPDAAVVDTHGRTALPGFVDAHTHPVFAGTRVDDFYARASGRPYQSRGIMETVNATRAASEDDLLSLAYRRAETFLRYGTTTIGARSGYGLTLEDELKSLRVLTRLQRLQSLKVVPGFLGAHVVPSDFPGDGDAYVTQLVDAWLPAVREYAVFADAWCDEGAFTAEQCVRILERARKLGFELTAHANELGPTDGVRNIAALRPRSVDHLIYLDDGDIAALKESNAVATLLPATMFFINSDRYAPARRLLDAGVPVALSTDFNPGTSYTPNLQFVLTLAVLKLGMTAEEALRAITVNGARAIGMEDRVGTLEVGKFCDIAILDTDDYRTIPYVLADNPVDTVIANGVPVVCAGNLADNPAPLVAAG